MIHDSFLTCTVLSVSCESSFAHAIESSFGVVTHGIITAVVCFCHAFIYIWNKVKSMIKKWSNKIPPVPVCPSPPTASPATDKKYKNIMEISCDCTCRKWQFGLEGITVAVPLERTVWRNVNHYLPVQFFPSPVYSGLHVQLYDPLVLLQTAFALQLCFSSSHSSTSEENNFKQISVHLKRIRKKEQKCFTHPKKLA